MIRLLKNFPTRVQNLFSSRQDLPENIQEPGHSHSCDRLDMLSPEFIKDPYPFYEELRKSGPVHYLQKHDIWLVLNYKDIAAGLKQTDLFSSRPAEGFDTVLLAAKPPEHTNARLKVAPVFSRQELSRYAGIIRARANTLLNRAEKQGEFDIIEDYAVPLTELVIADILGLCQSDVDCLRAMPRNSRYHLDYIPAVGEYFGQLLDKTRTPSDATPLLLTDFSPKELTSLMKLFWIAGTITTGILIGSSARIILNDDEMRSTLDGSPELMPSFIEEVLRFESPEITAWRVSTADAEIGGVSIPAGARMRFCLAAGNRDPAHYQDPSIFDIRRNPTDNLAFGFGPHYCLGANLSRMEARIALACLLERFPRLRPSLPLVELRYITSEHLRALESLPVRID